MATWPAELVITRDGYRESPPDLVMRSSMDTGPDKIRRRSTAGVRPVTMSLFLTDAQQVILDAFFVTDTGHGAFSFIFVSPSTGNTENANFVGPPEYARNGPMWNVAVNLEILP